MTELAPTRNIYLFADLAERVCNRNPDLPGIAVFYGFSGYGKTRAAEFTAHKKRAFYVEAGESWTRKYFLQKVAIEIGVPDKGSTPVLVERIIERLAADPRLLIVDEFDHIVARNFQETVREIHDKAQTPIIAIGEENLPAKIHAGPERFANRVLAWGPAQPADQNDFAQLAAAYCPDVTLSEELIQHLLKSSAGRARRICVNLDRIREVARTLGVDAVGVKECPPESLFTGQPPARRRA